MRRFLLGALLVVTTFMLSALFAILLTIVVAAMMTFVAWELPPIHFITSEMIPSILRYFFLFVSAVASMFIFNKSFKETLDHWENMYILRKKLK